MPHHLIPLAYHIHACALLKIEQGRRRLVWEWFNRKIVLWNNTSLRTEGWLGWSLCIRRTWSGKLEREGSLIIKTSLMECFILSCCSVTQSCPTLCNPVDCSTPGFPALHHLPEPAQTHVHWVRDAIQPSPPLSSPSPPAFSLSQHQDLF